MDRIERLKVKRIVVFVAGFDIKAKVCSSDLPNCNGDGQPIIDDNGDGG